jgi:tRNA (guanine37-N1)-methyltransferase
VFTIDVITLFPEVFAPFVGLSIVGKAVEEGLVDIRYHHLADACEGKERVDDEPFGGGAGMVLRLAPIAGILDRLLAESQNKNPIVVVPDPAGKRFTQADASRLSRFEHLIIVCGHYEGIDERLGSLYEIERFSLGDFVLTGGEIPALAFMDATVRLVEGVVKPESLEHESFGEAGLDYPAYTRPAVFRGVTVPEVLLSGDHAAIAAWRREQSRLRTAARRGK